MPERSPESGNNESPAQRGIFPSRREVLRQLFIAATGSILAQPRSADAGQAENKEILTSVKVRIAVQHPEAHTKPLGVDMNLGSKDDTLPARSEILQPTTPVDLDFPALKTTTIDIQGSSFRIIVDGVSTPPQASPYPITPKPGQRIEILVEDPIDSSEPDPTKPLVSDIVDVNKPNADITIEAPGTYYLPYTIEIFDAAGKSFRVLQSLDGKIPKDTGPLPAGDYFVQVRPKTQHYPVTSRLSVGEEPAAKGTRRANLRRTPEGVKPMLVPVRLKNGQTLKITVEEGIESYNQKMTHFEGVPVDIIFNTPYLFMNNPFPDDIRTGGRKAFEPNENDKIPNTILAYMELGSEGLAQGLAKSVAAGIMEDKGKPAQGIRTEYRWNHVTFSFALGPDGLVPKEYTQMTQENLETALTPVLHDAIEEVMRKPYRVVNAIDIHQRAATGFESSAVPIDTPVHYSKLDAIRDYGKKYAEIAEETQKK